MGRFKFDQGRGAEVWQIRSETEIEREDLRRLAREARKGRRRAEGVSVAPNLAHQAEVLQRLQALR